ncbi:hypothetical protein AVEN_239831-1 [Araneus ventricosus]|uniref:Uncharacterized protein n=1 Tax=Araneus ventricosus TaxID=182803 RepID=A0A4Y2NBP6_ARAVE|nr:hypothetical protein AVEN_239831-1 [Araneus ventricosus]
MFIPNLKEVFEWVFKNEHSKLVSRNKLGYLLFTLNLFATVPCESPSEFSVSLHRAPRVNTLLQRFPTYGSRSTCGPRMEYSGPRKASQSQGSFKSRHLYFRFINNIYVTVKDRNWRMSTFTGESRHSPNVNVDIHR